MLLAREDILNFARLAIAACRPARFGGLLCVRATTAPPTRRFGKDRMISIRHDAYLGLGVDSTGSPGSSSGWGWIPPMTSCRPALHRRGRYADVPPHAASSTPTPRTV